MNRLGPKGMAIITNKVSIVITDPLGSMANVNDSFSLEVDLKRNDGIYERVYINTLIPLNIYSDEKWEFEVNYNCINWGKFMG